MRRSFKIGREEKEENPQISVLRRHGDGALRVLRQFVPDDGGRIHDADANGAVSKIPYLVYGAHSENHCGQRGRFHLVDGGLWVRHGLPQRCIGARPIEDDLINEMGFSIQFPREKLSRASQEAQENWLEKTRPSIKKAENRDAVVVFEDEVKFPQEGTTRRNWARRGVGFNVYHEPCKRSAGYCGAMSMEEEPALLWMGSQPFDSTMYCVFLDEMVAHYGNVCLIVDNVGYHKSRIVKRKIRPLRGLPWVYWLPPYIPELNAIEGVWRETRKDATHNQHLATMKGLRRTVQSQVRTYRDEQWRLAGTVARFLRA